MRIGIQPCDVGSKIVVSVITLALTVGFSSGLAFAQELPTKQDEALEELPTPEEKAENEQVAAEAATESPVVLESRVEEIVVTARKRAELEQDIPLAITVLGQKQLQGSFNRDITQLQGYAPNVIIDAVRAGPGATAIAIRGISFQDVEKSFDPAIGMFIDDVYIGTTTSQLISNFDIGTVEILRGPQGTLFGKNTIGGAIRVTRTRPTGEFGAKASITTGSFKRNDYRVLFNAPIIENKLAAKLWFYSQNDDGYFYNETKQRKVGGQDYLTTGLTLLYEPTEEMDFLLTYEYIRDATPTAALVNMSQPAAGPKSPISNQKYLPGGDRECVVNGLCAVDNLDRVSYQNFSDSSILNLNAVTLQADFELGEIGELVSITGWRGHNEDANTDFDSTEIDFFSVNRKQHYDQVSQELRLTNSTLDWLNVVGGLYFWYAKYSLDQTSYYIAEQLLGVPADLAQTTTQRTYSVAPFMQADAQLLDWLTLTAGFRYTWEEKSIRDYRLEVVLDGNPFQTQACLGPPGPPDNCAETAPLTDDWGAFTPTVGLDARLDEDILTYFLYSRGFKSGGWNGRATSVDALGPYEPETVEAFEIGLKSDWWDQRIRANLALFWNIYDDKQEEIVVPAPPPLGQETIVQNASSARTRGVELELTIAPIEGFTLRQSFGYLDASYTDGDFALVQEGVSREFPFADLELRRAPKFQYAVFADYARELGPGVGLFHIDWRWIDSYQTTFLNYDFGKVRSHGTLNADVSYTFSVPSNLEWRIAVFGRNMTGETWVASGLEVGGLFSFAAINPPATWGLEVGVQF